MQNMIDKKVQRGVEWQNVGRWQSVGRRGGSWSLEERGGC